MYPTKDREKGPSLQNISTRLERLEVLLSRLAERSETPTVSAAYCGRENGGNGGGPQSQTQVQFGANVNASRTANQHPPLRQQSSKSTWELLLNDGQGVRYVNNSNIECLLQDVSLDFPRDLLLSLLLSTKVSKIIPQANQTHPPGRKN